MHLPKLTALFVLACLASASIARGQQVVQMVPFEQSGTIVSGNAGGLLLTVLGTQTAVHIDSPDFANAQTSMELTAKAKNSLLAPGAFVRFAAKLDAKGKRIIEPIDKITIFTPTAETRLGAFTDDLNAPPLAAEPGVGVGVAPPPVPAPKAAAPGEAFVVGRISRARKGEIGVQIPDRTLEAKLAVDAVIDVHLTDKVAVLATLKPGDSVHVDGMRSEAGKVYATKITAHLHRELGEDLRSMRPNKPAVANAPAGEEAADADAVNPREDFGVAAVEAADQAERDARPHRARILKVN